MSDFNPENMRKRFHMVTDRVKEIRAQSGPLRAQRDALIAEYKPKVAALEAEIRGIEAPLADLENERGTIARALGGKTGASA